MTQPDTLIPSVGSSRKPLVLVAEDDQMSAEMLQTMLERVGYEVQLAKDGAQALRYVEQSPAPDAILLDWMMPEMTGLEVCAELRKRFDAIELPILMVTAKADADSVSAAFEAGASDYITKPFLGAELRARIAAHLRVKQMLDDRRAMDEHLMEREKLSTLGLLVSGVAHELNNPLGGIYGYSQLLLEEETDPERLIALERIVGEVQRCNRIVADLLGFARRHTPERVLMDVSEVLTRTLAMRDRHLQARGLWPRLCLDPGLPTVFADEHQLQQVFLNIIINAEHALRERGTTLRITAECTSRRQSGSGEWLAVRIFNDGPQIPPEAQARIFEPLFTTKDKDEGTGLGLAISLRIIRDHGGDIEVESDEGGTTFTILLPASEKRAEAGGDAEAGDRRLAS